MNYLGEVENHILREMFITNRDNAYFTINCLEKEMQAMKLQRDIFKTVPMKSSDAEDDFVDLPPAERLSLVWDLTREVFSLSSEYDVKSRLRREVVTIIRTEM